MRASALSQEPNTKKQMVFGTCDEAESPSFWHVFSNETLGNWTVTRFLKSNND